ncbi:hypothetical protein TH66_04520 [Carbonactinospora thermoautotrophica]|uniref:Molybdopterin molybdenumtransferase n=1 Tax=Carbonactinospora thermoautotrophica TaxID=1469144 RepID=A0A132MMW5_9ACTN|nr:molybdopterin molybdotransferase MoeA [Carbonactinospora thermoautotrophica]KWW99196.1 MoeA domain protein domain I and II [Carbonactinospora thermoautotrophica]KWX05026.1 hypothetical protein TH66_04520 [Carbonactinospora thermoautotrophica]KWX09633.1 hypothetical protein TR74_08410 [Carbonactinospora thermoautotrophica]
MTELPWPEARARAHQAAEPLPAIELPLREALGRVLAGDLVALADLPPFDAAAMDGYAVSGPGPWRVTQRIMAGGEPSAPLAKGQAAEVATGSPLAPGTECVLPYEDAERIDGLVYGELKPGLHVRRAGEDYRAGTVLVPAGSPVSPVVLGLAASAGYDRIRVRPRPTVAALVTGNELVDSGLPTGTRVRDAIGPMLPGLVSAFGGEMASVRQVSDNPAELRDALAESAEQAHVVVICGASSAGPADYLREVLAGLGGRPLISSVACRPGHPQSLSLLPDGVPVVGLPGNPFAALVAVMTLLEPLLARLTGQPLAVLPRCRFEGYVRFDPHRTRLVPVMLGSEVARPAGHTRPGLLWGAALADALAAIPPAWDGHSPVPLLRLPR